MSNIVAKLDRVNKILVNSLTGVGCALLAVMVSMMTVDVLGRWLFSKPLASGYEVSGQVLLVGIIFFSLARANHTALTVVVQRFPKKIKLAVHSLVILISIGFFAVMTWQTFSQAVHSYVVHETLEAVWQLPYYPTRFAVTLGVALLTFTLVITLLKVLLGKVEDPFISD